MDANNRVTALFDFDLAAQETRSFGASLQVSQSSDEPEPRHLFSIERARDAQRTISESWLGDFTRLTSNDRQLNTVFDRSLRDLRLLRTRSGDSFIAGGLPWFVSPFGRDSIIAALQSLPYEPTISIHTLRFFAKHQGRHEDAQTGEQPGKIPHELRVGEMARLGEIPQRPSYTSVDATPLFLILAARHAAWSGNLDLFIELRESIDGALRWLDDYGDANGDGYVDYTGANDEGLINQGWKDSGTAIVAKDGGAPTSPIALVEVQGYVYLARNAIADLYRRAGDDRIAEQLTRKAQALRTRFNHDFWMEDDGCYCLALAGDGRQVSVITSNPGHALWAGIAEPDRALKTAERLMQPDMFSGWGIRTLSSADMSFNPINYHLGSVWPFDNALFFAGLRRYGLDEGAMRVFDGMLAAADCFANGRLPEFFVGFQREPGLFPARCPLADPLQAWSAGAVPLMVEAMLGLQPEAFERRLRIVDPLLPASVDWLELHGLRLGHATIDLRFERREDGGVATMLLSSPDGCEILVT